MVLLLIELQQVLFAVKVVFQLLDLLFELVFRVFPLKLYVLLDLGVNQELSVESISLLFNFNNPQLKLRLLLSELLRNTLNRG